MISPSSVFTSGFTSTSVASSSRYTSHSDFRTGTILAPVSASKPAASTISFAFASSMPVLGSTAILARASGRSTASCSISMPPSLLHIAR